jgi:hypothetical protein
MGAPTVKRRLLRSLAAGTLAVTLGLTGTVTPAHAAPVVKPMAVDIYSLIAEIGIQLLSQVFSGGGGVSEADLNAAVAQITAEIEQTRTEIINHIDLVASADVQACVRTNTIEFASINSMSRTVEQLWAQSATACATRATAYLNALTSPAAVDNIGWLVGEIFTIVIAARTKGGLTEGLDLVRQDEISAFNSVVVKLIPPCESYSVPLSPIVPIAEIHVVCTEYNGDSAEGVYTVLGGQIIGTPLDPETLNVQAARNTSRPGAQSALAGLLALP